MSETKGAENPPTDGVDETVHVESYAEQVEDSSVLWFGGEGQVLGSWPSRLAAASHHQQLRMRVEGRDRLRPTPFLITQVER